VDGRRAGVGETRVVAVTDDEEGVETEGRREAELGGRDEGWEPATLSVVSEEEDDIVLLDQLCQGRQYLLELLLSGRRDGVAGHGDGEGDTTGVARREDLAETGSSSLSLGTAAIETVFISEKSLSHRIREGNATVVHKRDVLHTPSDETSGHVASKSPRPDQKALGLKDLLEAQVRNRPPADELQVEVHLGLSNTMAVHHRAQIKVSDL